MHCIYRLVYVYGGFVRVVVFCICRFVVVFVGVVFGVVFFGVFSIFVCLLLFGIKG